MEVHHHPHVEKKSFKEYLLEGLMIFLAVSMGFIAENIREKVSEHEIEKRNMEIIVDNLKEDTASLVRTIKHSKLRIQLLDSVLVFQNKELKDSIDIKKFGNYFIKSANINLFQTNKAAYEQMKSSGSLRLIKRKIVLDSLFSYSNLNDRIDYNSGIISENSKLIVEDAANFINFHNLVNGNSVIEIKQNPNEIFRFYNHSVSLQVRIAGTIILLERQLENAKRLIKLLQEEYHIENE